MSCASCSSEAGQRRNVTAAATPRKVFSLPSCLKPDEPALPTVDGQDAPVVVSDRLTHTFSVDNGALVAVPVKASVQSAVSAAVARCTLMASVSVAGSIQTPQFRNATVALAELTIDQSRLPNPSKVPTPQSTPDQKVGHYDRRLAWIAVTTTGDRSFMCPMGHSSPAPGASPSAGPPRDGEAYEVRAIARGPISTPILTSCPRS